MLQRRHQCRCLTSYNCVSSYGIRLQYIQIHYNTVKIAHTLRAIQRHQVYVACVNSCCAVFNDYRVILIHCLSASLSLCSALCDVIYLHASPRLPAAATLWLTRGVADQREEFQVRIPRLEPEENVPCNFHKFINKNVGLNYEITFLFIPAKTSAMTVFGSRSLNYAVEKNSFVTSLGRSKPFSVTADYHRSGL